MTREELIEKIVFWIFDKEVELNSPDEAIEQIKDKLKDERKK